MIRGHLGVAVGVTLLAVACSDTGEDAAVGRDPGPTAEASILSDVPSTPVDTSPAIDLPTEGQDFGAPIREPVEQFIRAWEDGNREMMIRHASDDVIQTIDEFAPDVEEAWLLWEEACQTLGSSGAGGCHALTRVQNDFNDQYELWWLDYATRPDGLHVMRVEWQGPPH